MRKLLLALLFTMAVPIFGSAVRADDTIPVGVQVRPLTYHESLKQNAIEKGFIDVSNPSKQTVTLDTSVQLFSQIDDQGSLKFYDASYIKKAIVPDLKEFDLGPHEAVRLYFTVNSAELPDGDVLAAIFVTNKTAAKPLSITPAVRVGTLLIFENGKPGPRNSAITDFNLQFIQFSDDIHGKVSIKNMAKPTVQSAFFADITFSVSPWGETVKKQSSLITSDRTRSMDFSIPSNQIGFFKVTISTNTASAYKWVFVVTGVWRMLVFVCIAGFLAVIVIIWVVIKKRR